MALTKKQLAARREREERYRSVIASPKACLELRDNVEALVVLTQMIDCLVQRIDDVMPAILEGDNKAYKNLTKALDRAVNAMLKDKDLYANAKSGDVTEDYCIVANTSERMLDLMLECLRAHECGGDVAWAKIANAARLSVSPAQIKARRSADAKQVLRARSGQMTASELADWKALIID